MAAAAHRRVTSVPVAAAMEGVARPRAHVVYGARGIRPRWRRGATSVTKRQQQQLVRAALYGIFVVAVLAIVVIADWDTIQRNFFNAEIARDMFPEVITIAARNTLLYTALAFSFGLAFGLLLALMRLSTIRPYRWLATVYIETFRGLPALLTIFLIGQGIPIAFGTRWPILLNITLGLGIVAAAYMAETIRAGI
jgi:polar amino acid transport system permease protein